MTEQAESATDHADLPSGRHGSSRALYWLLGLALLYTLYFAKTLLMLIVVAGLFTLLLGPVVAWLKRFHVPRSISAVLLLCAIGGPFTLLAVELSEPAQRWVKQVPELTAKVTEQISTLTQGEETRRGPLIETRAEEQDSGGFFSWFHGDEEEEADPPPAERAEEDSDEDPVSAKLKEGGLEMLVNMLAAAPLVIAQLVTSIILTLFLLIFGPRLFETFVDSFSLVREKRQTIRLVGGMQLELSRYIVTVSLINTGLGLTTALVLWLLGMEDPLLWGVMVGLFNFAPYVGPLVSLAVLSLAGIAQYGLELMALLPAVVYFTINMFEAQLVTPLVLGRNMRLNPLIIMLWLMIWGWMWGAVGVLLAVPLLVCLKLAAGQLNVLGNWVRLIETRA
ncbi:AI-2E family transporter [Halopseudomonas salegens]|uniref:Predicted PurR-regulated permease PerM n=1 Tax=Halopseudomonas salegens TaxID=1434072 RepID=A0A1H2GZQ1_9GAMM|nr:AI-2E family transporter [Halopseudomonas salegens]SDU24985.1 Predicted PurR-regulated permease PerM [Halopseudomonas salegens]